MPQITGALAIRAPADQFVKAFQERVASGLFGTPSVRARYSVIPSGQGELRLRAANWWTAINVGLNDVMMRFPSPGSVQYEVRYWRWASFVLGLGGVFGLAGIVTLLIADARGYIAQHPASRFPGLSLDQNLLIAWALILFWGFVWPWLLIAIHKVPLRRLVARLVAEVDDRASSNA